MIKEIGYAVSDEDCNKLHKSYPNIKIYNILTEALDTLKPGDIFVLVSTKLIGATVEILLTISNVVSKSCKFICLDSPLLNLDTNRQEAIAYVKNLSQYEINRRKTNLLNLSKYRGKKPRTVDSLDKKTAKRMNRIIELYTSGVSIRKICKEVKLTMNTIYKILKLKNIPLRSKI